MASLLRRAVIGGVVGGGLLYGAIKVRDYGNNYNGKRDFLLNPTTATPIVDVNDPLTFKLLDRLLKCEQANVFVEYAKGKQGKLLSSVSVQENNSNAASDDEEEDDDVLHYPIPPLSSNTPSTVEGLASYYPATMAIQGYLRYISQEARYQHLYMLETGEVDASTEGFSKQEGVLADALVVLEDILRIFKDDWVMRELQNCEPSKLEEMEKQHRFQIGHLFTEDAEVQRQFKNPMLRFLICLFHSHADSTSSDP